LLNQTRAEAQPNDPLEGFIASHMSVMAGVDFFTVEMLNWRALQPITFSS